MVLRKAGCYVNSPHAMSLACLPAAVKKISEAHYRASRMVTWVVENPKDQGRCAHPSIRTKGPPIFSCYRASFSPVPLSRAQGALHNLCQKGSIYLSKVTPVPKLELLKKAATLAQGGHFRPQGCDFWWVSTRDLHFSNPPDDTVLQNARDEIIWHLFLPFLSFCAFSCSKLHMWHDEWYILAYVTLGM